VKGFFRSLKFKVFVVIALVLIGLMIRTAVGGGFASFTADAVSFVVSPVQKLSSSVSGFFSGIVNDIATFSTEKGENAQLKKQISDLQSKIVNYDDMLRENQQLSQGLDLLKENPDYKLKPAIVISHNPEQWFSSFTIDKGSRDGIKYQDAVITSTNDLIGKVMEVYPHSAVVATILDPSVPAGILISETGDSGQSQGDLSLLSKGEFKAGFLPKDSAVSPGDIVVTSGIGGIFPKNLKVGTVDNVSAEDTGSTLYAVCRPMVSPASLKNIFVLTDFSGKDLSVSKNGGS
jgi:rod shape-determining protein MreC